MIEQLPNTPMQRPTLRAIADRQSGYARKPMSESKKDWELKTVERFRSASGELAGWELVPYERPDVIARSSTCIVGIEVTRLYQDESSRGSPRQEQSGIADSIVKRARREYATRSPDSRIDVMVCFRHHCILKRGKISTIAQALVELVIAVPTEPGAVKILRSEDYYDNGMPQEIAFVRIADLRDSQELHWGRSGAIGWAGETSFELLSRKLAAKERKLVDFERIEGPIWLLIVCDGRVETSFLKIHSGLENEQYTSYFNRAFVIDAVDGRCAELKILPKQDGLTEFA